MEYSEAVKKNEEDLNVLLGGDLPAILFREKNKSTAPSRIANRTYHSTCVRKRYTHTRFCAELSRKIHIKLLMTECG